MTDDLRETTPEGVWSIVGVRGARSIAGERLALRRLTVIDATNVPSEARKPLVALIPSTIKTGNMPPKSCFIPHQPRCDLTHLESKWLVGPTSRQNRSSGSLSNYNKSRLILRFGGLA